MKSINSFKFGVNPVRVVMVDGAPMWVAKDVAEALGYVWKGASGTMLHIPEEWMGVYSVQTPSGYQSMVALSEQGLYFFLGRSDKAAALPMQKWVAGEVLPSIRKTGSYNVQDLIPKTLPEALRAYAVALEEKATLALKIQEDAPKVEFHARVAEAQDGQSVGTVAKILGTGQNRLFQWLRGKRILMDSNAPYQEHIDAGRFRVIEQTWQGNTSQHVSTKTLVTGKGLIWLQKLWDEDHDLGAVS